MPTRILIVEDDLDIAELVARYLEKAGFVTERATSGREALTAIAARAPGLLILDLMLPHVDGLEVCRQMKQVPELRSTRIIALTAFSQDEYRERAAKAGCELYLVKPVKTTVLEQLFE